MSAYLADFVWWFGGLLVLGLAIWRLASALLRSALAVRRRRSLERRWLDQWHAADMRPALRGPYVLGHGMRFYTSPYGTHNRAVVDADAAKLERGPAEAGAA